MLIYIYGPDTFRSRQYLNEQVLKFKQVRDPEGYNVVFVDATKVDPGKILSEISSAPFLAEKRMIIIENILSLSDKEFLADIIRRVEADSFPETNVIIFWQGENKSKVKEADLLEKLLVKIKYAKDFPLLTGVHLTQWVKSEIATRGGNISSPALSFLVANAGGEMWVLNSLLDQLIAYKNGQEIDLKAVGEFLDEKVDDNVFNMVNAIVTGNKKQALKLLQEQRRLGEDDFKLFGLIIWQFRALLSLRDLFENDDRLTSDLAAQKTGLNPFVVKKSWPLVKNFTSHQLKTLYQGIIETDLKAKTGQADLSLMLDLFVGRV
ncbi:MAG TPA: DNA polymerase III subunit delta [Patescibacteria group bacterium]|nr:DNA polymerase III subunit delta [Patescibacteria group bacterium]